MPRYHFNILSEFEAIEAIYRNKGRFVPWIGAGVSMEADIPGADVICGTLASDFIKSKQKEREINGEPLLEDVDRLRDRELSWGDRSLRYARTIKRRLPAKQERVNYFRKLVSSHSPAFAHYAIALLIRHQIFPFDCVTTNFDKLLERAFYDLGALECQPIRAAWELPFYQERPDDKAFCIKIHGDYDTHNILNTEDETVVIEKEIAGRLNDILKNRAVLVIGSAGFEKSIHTLFDTLTTNEARNRQLLQYGLLWAVYVKDRADDPRVEVERAIEKGDCVSQEIVKLMDRNVRSADGPFAFFPLVGGAGQFFQRLIRYSDDQALIQLAQPYFDHEMRIKAIFKKQGLSEQAAVIHIGRLREAGKRLTSSASQERRAPVWEYRSVPIRDPFTMSFCYGSLADASLLNQGRSGFRCAAILSPDDNFISIGGGTALAVAKAAGYRNLVHDVSKLAPIAVGDVAVTGAGNLPVEYILHGASVELGETDIIWSEKSIRDTVRSALVRCVALGTDVLFVPLLAAGAGRAAPRESLANIFQAISEFEADAGKGKDQGLIHIVVVAFDQRQLPRGEYDAEFERRFPRIPEDSPRIAASAAHRRAAE